MSINSYLEETASNLIIKGNEKESINVSLNIFMDRMRDYFSNKESVNLKEIKVFGSYQQIHLMELFPFVLQLFPYSSKKSILLF